jgi:hypothetical protein
MNIKNDVMQNKIEAMSQYSLYLLVVLVVLIVQSCTDPLEVGNDFFREPVTVDINQDSIFAKAESAESFLFNAYRSLPYGPAATAGPFDTDEINFDPLASLTDINQSYSDDGGATNLYYEGRYNSSEEQNRSFKTKYNYFNSGAWSGIRQSHIFISNIDRVPDMSSNRKERLKAEAWMIIAVHYMELFRNYGGVPWVDHAFSPNEEFDIQRLTARATLDSTLKVIDAAIPHLPFTLDNPQTEAGRFTQAGAMGLKARLLLFAASPLFNSNEPYMGGEAASSELVWFGSYDAELWQQAADAAKELIDKVEQAGGYYLADTGNPQKDFKHAYYDRDSPEILISTRKLYKATGFPGNEQARGTFLPTDNYVKMFPMASGVPISESGSGYDPQNPYENRDPRLYQTILLNGEPYQGRPAELYIGGRERLTIQTKRASTGYQARKFLLDITTASSSPVQFPYLRLPEVYLSYAEALNEINNGPTPEAYEYINKVRNRVDLGGLPEELSKEEFREAVLKERALEFGYEEVRWYDLIRWKKEEVFTKTLYGMNLCKKGETPRNTCEGEYGSNNFIYDRFEIPARDWKNDFSPKWYLSAFPRNEVLKGYLLQNPGW